MAYFINKPPNIQIDYYIFFLSYIFYIYKRRSADKVSSESKNVKIEVATNLNETSYPNISDGKTLPRIFES
jgi:hypothetical protein